LETIENGRSRLASPDEIDTHISNETAAIILCGHSLIPRIVAISDNQLVVNPGSVGLQAYDESNPSLT
jgi:predicted phosphodiesterase